MVFFPQQAFAAGDSVYYAYSQGNATYVKFESNGERFFVCDNASDGHHAVGYYNFPESSTPGIYYPVHHYGGAGGCKLVDLSVGEGKKVKFQACIGEGESVYACGPYKTGTA